MTLRGSKGNAGAAFQQYMRMTVTVEKLWRQFFSDPSEWWDHRLEKGNPRYPDFKHKTRKEVLWLNNKYNPPWVEAELASLAPGTVQSHNYSWNTRIAKYVKAGQCKSAMELFQEMQQRGMNLDTFTFVSVLNACAGLKSLEEGRRIHSQIIQSSCDSDIFVCNSLIDMYIKCGSIEDAWRVFNSMPLRDVVVWNVMLLGNVRYGQGQKALELYQEMQREGVEPDSITFVGVLNACASIGAIEEGREVHTQLIHRCCQSNVFIGNSLVDMYVKCGSLEDAWKVFNTMAIHTVVSWNAVILGHVKCGQAQKALDLYRKMQQEGLKPDHVTFVAVLNACASVVALEEGRFVHEKIIQSGCEADVFIGNSLIDMYAKCGSIANARSVFNKMPARTVVSWNTMLGGYAIHGLGREAVVLFQWMSQERVKMDKVTFVSLLSACGHAGLVDEGLHYFETMSSVYRISAEEEHYSCIVDLLGRAGRLRDAEDLINIIFCEPSVPLLMSMLGACRIHGNMEIGERVAKQLVELHPEDSAGYVLLSNIYSAAGDYESSENIQRQRLENGVQKQPGCTWIEVNNKVHSFKVDDQEHPQIVEIHAELKRLSKKLEEIGYAPYTIFVHDVDDEEKSSRLLYHSEKLAITCGLLNTRPGTPLRIFKNLRVCGDCHTATKLIAKLAEREIILRDAYRFHHFKDGVCSCEDYW